MVHIKREEKNQKKNRTKRKKKKKKKTEEKRKEMSPRTPTMGMVGGVSASGGGGGEGGRASGRSLIVVFSAAVRAYERRVLRVRVQLEERVVSVVYPPSHHLSGRNIPPKNRRFGERALGWITSGTV